MRLVVIGSTSFIGRELCASWQAKGRPMLALRRPEDADVAGLGQDDVIVNCCMHPDYRNQSYSEAIDVELQTARSLAAASCRQIMLSTRRVYSPAERWGARESDPARGDDTLYGKNKARTESALRDLLDRLTILRLSNVFGFEYARGREPRRSFFGLMLHRLKERGEILFDMAAETRRDFIPVSAAARAIARVADDADAPQILNVGVGEAVRCGDLAEAIIAGFGSGTLRAEGPVTDEFYLDMSAFNTRYGPHEQPTGVTGAARRLGEQLRNA